jgi:hypothetical protein
VPGREKAAVKEHLHIDDVVIWDKIKKHGSAEPEDEVLKLALNDVLPHRLGSKGKGKDPEQVNMKIYYNAKLYCTEACDETGALMDTLNSSLKQIVLKSKTFPFTSPIQLREMLKPKTVARRQELSADRKRHAKCKWDLIVLLSSLGIAFEDVN